MFGNRPLDQFVLHGLAVLFVAFIAMTSVRGLEFRAVLLFVGPPLLAVLYMHSANGPGNRRVAGAFLLLLGVGVIIAHTPTLFPKLGGFERRLPAWQDRTLTWYLAVYLVFAASVVPLYLLISNLRAHRRGEPTTLARPICRLGLLPATLLTVMLPSLLAEFFGVWPIW